ncbi:MAG: hypothetical protein Fur0011_3230 [Candidatus Microgenomates bacterium]
MPDTINKQTLINLLIDSPLREPIKINLIDIVNNTSEPDLPRVYPTIVKELEIFQKATERRMKLADETIAKLNGATEQPTMEQEETEPQVEDVTTTTPAPLTPPPLDLPPLPTPQSTSPIITTPAPQTPPTQPTVTEPVNPPVSTKPLSVPPLDLPPMPTVSAPIEPNAQAQAVAPAPTNSTPQLQSNPGPLPSPEPLGGPAPTQSSDEAALAEIQKELESLKANVAADAKPAPAPQA